MSEERKQIIEELRNCQQEHNTVRHGDTVDDAYDRAIDCITKYK